MYDIKLNLITIDKRHFFSKFLLKKYNIKYKVIVTDNLLLYIYVCQFSCLCNLILVK